ncbi:MAG: hypothetical protein Q8L36_03760, partial [bacterium]|nr:hypothetical protein [bacterium]
KGNTARAYDFDGANTKIDTGSEWIGTQAVTISAWIYLDGWGGGVMREELLPMANLFLKFMA